MTLFDRLNSFRYYEGRLLAFTCVFVLGLIMWRYHDAWFLTILAGGSVIAFGLTYLFRHSLIRKYPRVRRRLNQVTIAFIIVTFASQALGHGYIGGLAFGLHCVVTVGVLFWCATDPMFEMINWLAFPTEWGAPPDEIFLVDQRGIRWPGELDLVQCYLFKFRYDDEWDYGITGPITFSLADEAHNGKSPEEIYSAYAQWFGEEGVGEMIKQELGGD